MGEINNARQLLERIEEEANPSPSEQHQDMLSDEFERFSYYVKTNNDFWDVNPDRTPVGSGGFRTLFKRLVRKTTGWYTRPAFDEQRQFNASVTRAFNELVQMLEASQSRIVELESRLEILDRRQHRTIKDVRINSKDISNVSDDVQLVSNDVTRVFDKLGLQDEEVERMSDSLYVEFENTYRGSNESVRNKQKVYMPYVIDCPAAKDGLWLDIGCGRGEWLQLLGESGISARGADMNSDMVDVCLSKGLDAEHADAITALRNFEEASLGGVSAFHVAEHISFETLILMLHEAMRAIKPGGMLILETPNPESLSVSGYSFYLDPSHRNPIPPESLEFFVGKMGFTETRVMRMVRRGEKTETGNADIDTLLERMNMEQDYAVIARRP